MTGTPDAERTGMTVPSQIGRLRVLGRIGAGATATVWRAHDPVLDTDVAVKVLADTLIDDADVRRRFEQEAQLLRAAEADSLVRVYDVGELPDGRPYLVMTYADAGTLEQRATQPWPVGAALLTGAQLADAVAVLHAGGALHRDVKPSNVLYRSTPDGEDQLLLADLGLGKAIGQASQLTLAVGTPGYAAPEQLRAGGRLTPAADVYGIAAVTYRLLTGRSPQQAREDAGRRGSIPPPSSLQPGIPGAVDDAVLAGLAGEPGRRPASAGAYAVSLRRLASENHRLLRIRPGRIGAVLALTACLAGAGYGFSAWNGARTVSLQDVTGRIQVTVPRAWAGHVSGGGWAPQLSTSSAGQLAAALTAGTDLAGMAARKPGAAGVFIGVAPDGSTSRMVNPAGCRTSGGRRYQHAGWRGTLITSACPGSMSLQQATLSDPNGTTVLVQVVEPGRPDHLAQVLEHLSVAAVAPAPATSVG